MAPLTGSQSSRTCPEAVVLRSAGETSCGAAVGQFELLRIVNFATGECIDGHSSRSASTLQATTPGGRVLVIEVSLVLAMSFTSPPSSDANTRYSSAPLTGLHVSVTGEATFVAPSAGAMTCGASPAQVAEPCTTNVPFAEASGVGQPSKSASTYQMT